MRNFKRIAAAAISATMLFSTMSLNAFAATMTPDEAAAVAATDIAATDLVVAELSASSTTVAPGGTFDLIVKLSGKEDKTKVLNVGQAITTIGYDTTKFTMEYTASKKTTSYEDPETEEDVYFALKKADFLADNGSGQAVLGGLAVPYKIIPTSDFAVITVTVAADAAGQYEFVASQVAAMTPASAPLINNEAYKLMINVSNEASTPTEAPATEAPATEAPATEAPATEAPATEAPATEAPATEAPATEAPTDEPETGISITKPSIKAGKDFSVTVTRPNGTNAGKATVTITDAEGNPIGEPVTVEIPENETKTKVEFGALPNVAKGDKVTISVTYYEGDVEVGTDSETVTVKSATSGGTSATTPVVGGGSGSSKPSATTEPTATEDPTATTNPEATTEPSDVTVPSTDSIFVDVPVQAAWAEADINTLAKAGIVNGVSATEFAPNANVTREQFVKMIVGALGLDLVDSAVAFNDVETGAYYVPYIATAVKNGIVTGMSDEWFGVGENITREDMATILYRALKLNGTNVPAFSDAADIAGYAQPAVAELASLGVITGYEDGTFLPKNNATRAEAAVVINRVLNIIAADDEEVVEDVVEDTTEEVVEDATEETTTEVE